ncbi:LLM class flavin-dependent oxidoreductase [Natronogracilivirga saccharolytica]|uniref:LLM class flavin-dependent oxidoreductase n=1 Tax=Natronogracilivirga saccharolytica TaxID=2812953 RepID=A0A8J7UVM4_9BACT|nr:LLM class flavin-dependent oxidoreductase [Natronogracilivirga saccharolytica]MBP3191319.1 LLM class flavin-dependent oxidoreductase [Natronogracilivirga saccharolytica]
MELGIYSFAENTPIAGSSQTRSPGQRMQDLLEEVELADQAGLDVFGIGEHHRSEYLASSPAVILSAAAAKTRNIRLTSAVTVLGSEDPVRVFQQFSTLDQISGGRAEIMAGRGSFIESFPLFGQDLENYDEIFSEKLQLLMKLRESERITWSGKHRPAINNRAVYPRSQQDLLPLWVAVGGSPQSAVRTGNLGLPMALAIIGGQPAQFAPFVQLHQQAAKEAGHPAPPVSINSHGFISEDSRQAKDYAFPAFKLTMDRIGRERGWPAMTREQFDASCTIYGANIVGSPSEVTDKILHQHELFGHHRFLMQLTVGSLPHKKVLRAIELFGSEVAPAVRKETSAAAGSTA